MFVEGGWTPPGEPPPRPRLSKRDENIILGLVALLAVLMLIAPIGGATIIEALVVLVRAAASGGTG